MERICVTRLAGSTGLNRLSRCPEARRTSLFAQGIDDRTVYTALEEAGVDALIAIGGEGTYRWPLSSNGGDSMSSACKTIDNDLAGGGCSTGFGTPSVMTKHRGSTSGEAVIVMPFVKVMKKQRWWIAGAVLRHRDFQCPRHPDPRGLSFVGTDL